MGKFFALLPFIRKVLDSYLDSATGFPDKHCVLSPRPCTQMTGYHIKIGHENFHVLSSWLITNLRINGHYITAWADPGVDLRPLACWNCGFEFRPGHVCLSVVSVVCCQVEVSASGWSLVRRSSTEWCVWVWSCSPDNEEALAIGALRIFLWGGRVWLWD
jgi:hypothetical protein